MVDTSKKYYIFQEGTDVMFVSNVPPEELDGAIIQAFKEEVKTRGLDRIIFPHVEDLILKANQGDVVKIGGIDAITQREAEEEAEEEPVEEIDPENLPFSIKVNPDGMAAVLEIDQPTDSITREHIDAALEFNGIKTGLIEENIERVIREWPKVFNTIIAKGEQPVDGEDAELVMVKDFKDDLIPEVTEDGLVDFKELNLISPISVSEILQIRTPPTPGTAGITVFGKEIPATPGKDLKLQKGQNTEETNEGTRLVAQLEGFLHRGNRGELNVRPVYTVNGDVDYSIGNIKYKSDVLVRGDVRGGFEIEAGGDVRIIGAVEDATIHAGGSIVINGGIVSSGDAHIKAEGDVSVGFIQNGTIEAGGSVYVKIEAIGATIHAGRDMEVARRDGRIIGCDITVGGWVVTQEVGSENCPTLKIMFKGRKGQWENPDDRFVYNFLSTRSIKAPVRVVFGSIATEIFGIDPPLTISIKDSNISLENKFVGAKEIKQLRRLREATEMDEEQ